MAIEFKKKDKSSLIDLLNKKNEPKITSSVEFSEKIEDTPLGSVWEQQKENNSIKDTDFISNNVNVEDKEEKSDNNIENEIKNIDIEESGSDVIKEEKTVSSSKISFKPKKGSLLDALNKAKNNKAQEENLIDDKKVEEEHNIIEEELKQEVIEDKQENKIEDAPKEEESKDVSSNKNLKDLLQSVSERKNKETVLSVENKDNPLFQTEISSDKQEIVPIEIKPKNEDDGKTTIFASKKTLESKKEKIEKMRASFDKQRSREQKILESELVEELRNQEYNSFSNMNITKEEANEIFKREIAERKKKIEEQEREKQRKIELENKIKIKREKYLSSLQTLKKNVEYLKKQDLINIIGAVHKEKSITKIEVDEEEKINNKVIVAPKREKFKDIREYKIYKISSTNKNIGN